MVQRGPVANDWTKIEPRKRQHRRAGRVVDSSRACPTSKIANLLQSLTAATPYRPGSHAGRLPKSTHGPRYRRGCAAEQVAALGALHQYVCLLVRYVRIHLSLTHTRSKSNHRKLRGRAGPARHATGRGPCPRPIPGGFRSALPSPNLIADALRNGHTEDL